LWLHLTPYDGLNHDAQGYAAQGIASLQPDPLAGDLFLKFRSQEEFTVFPKLYGYWIDQVGLDAAAAFLTIACQALWYGIAYLLLRRLAGSQLAAIGTGLLLTTPAVYGGLRVFHLAEPFLTARLPAEILSLAGIWAWLAGRRALAVGSLLAALVIHPLIAFPAALLTGMVAVRESRSLRSLILLTVAGVALAVAGSFVLGDAEPLMQGRWLALTQLRSRFLFPLMWNVIDWNHLLLSLLTLTIGCLALRGTQAGRLLQSTLLLALAGLSLSLVYEVVAPLKVLIQGQPWRWLWPARFLAIGALPAILTSLWSAGQASRAAALCLAAGWLFVVPLSSHSSAVMMTGALLAALALLLRLASATMSGQTAALALKGAWVVLAGVLAGCAVTSSLAWFMADRAQLGGSGLTGHVANVLRLITPATILAVGCAVVVLHAWTPLRGAVVLLLGVFLVGTAAPSAARAWTATPYSGAALETFADWRARIPRDAEVLWWERLRETWFLLGRRSYLTRSQSGGVVFAPELADEVVRRALVLEPLVDRDFWIGAHAREDTQPAPLTSGILAQICRDPELGFVIWDVDLGVGAPSVHWPDAGGTIYLYDCGPFRAGAADVG
jgi:hypothetical protein